MGFVLSRRPNSRRACCWRAEGWNSHSAGTSRVRFKRHSGSCSNSVPIAENSWADERRIPILKHYTDQEQCKNWCRNCCSASKEYLTTWSLLEKDSSNHFKTRMSDYVQCSCVCALVQHKTCFTQIFYSFACVNSSRTGIQLHSEAEKSNSYSNMQQALVAFFVNFHHMELSWVCSRSYWAYWDAWN